ncbi:Serine/threonine-protein kinase TOR [Camellia lanceoleosa]|uniref:Serine/threonine-protein kinase TOR n=1 Tax=Camellia lanceoleosa TaxID=1840588 RepID=A0ACC0H3E3_9ERIC|nr:Serine/threonine-protein kinase TOR [Camellia lanceoleosa]
MLNFAKDYDHLPLIAKVEVFECALQNSERNDHARVFWLKSHTSKNGLDRRTNYTRSLAVMSMSIGFVGPGIALNGLTMAKHPSIASAWLTLAVGLKSFSHCGFLVSLQVSVL